MKYSIEGTIKSIVRDAIEESEGIRAREITKHFEKRVWLDEIKGDELVVVIDPASRFDSNPSYRVTHPYYGQFVGGIGKHRTPGKPYITYTPEQMREWKRLLNRSEEERLRDIARALAL